MSDKFLKYFSLDIIMIFSIILIMTGIFMLRTDNQENNTDYAYNQENSNSLFNQKPGNEISLEYDDINDNKQETLETKTIEIPSGISTLEAARILENNNIVDADELLYIINLFDMEKRIASGTYQFSRDTKLSQILDEIIIPVKGGEKK